MVPVPIYWTWTKITPQKILVFLVKSLYTEVITSLTETLELPSFGHVASFTLLFESRDKILLVTPWTEIMTPQPFFKKIFILSRSEVAIFAGIVKTLTTFIKKTLKTQENLEELELMCLNGIYICISWYGKICKLCQVLSL